MANLHFWKLLEMMLAGKIEHFARKGPLGKTIQKQKIRSKFDSSKAQNNLAGNNKARTLPSKYWSHSGDL